MNCLLLYNTFPGRKVNKHMHVSSSCHHLQICSLDSMAKGNCLVQAPSPVCVCSQYDTMPNSLSYCHHHRTISLGLLLSSHLCVQRGL